MAAKLPRGGMIVIFDGERVGAGLSFLSLSTVEISTGSVQNSPKRSANRLQDYSYD